MTDDIRNYVRHTNQMEWQPLLEDGVQTAGIHIKSLRHDSSSSRSPTIQLKFEPGASYPYHNHPSGEEIFVLEGEVTVGEITLRAGDYLYTPPGFKHRVSSERGCILHLVIPAEVEILGE